jgi:tetratricopeptide (TPR) repeat protein
LPQGATLVVEGDNETFLTAYATRLRGLRPDVTLIHRRGYIFGDVYGLAGMPRSRWTEIAHRADLERLRESRVPVYYTTPPQDLVDAGVVFHQEGLVARALPPLPDWKVPPRRVEPKPWLPPAEWPRSAALLTGNPKRYDYVTRKLAVSYSDAAARALWNQGLVLESIPWFEDAARVGYDFAGAHLNLATALAAGGVPERALDELLRARAVAPLDPEPAARLAVFLGAAGRHEDAARWFERAYRIDPLPTFATDAARAWARAGNTERSRYWRERTG